MHRLFPCSWIGLWFVSLLNILFVSPSNAQVEIREKIRIGPTPSTVGQASSQGSVLQAGEEVSYDVFTAVGKNLVVTTPLPSIFLRRTAEVSASCFFPSNPQFCDEYRVELSGAVYEVTPGGVSVTTVDVVELIAGCFVRSAVLVIRARDRRGPLVSQFNPDRLVISGPIATFSNSGTLGGITAEGTVRIEIPEDSPYATGKVTFTTIELTADPTLCWGDPFLSTQVVLVDAFDQAGARWKRCEGLGLPPPDPVATIAVTGTSVFLETFAEERGGQIQMPLSQLIDEGILLVVDENANIAGDFEDVTLTVTAGNVVGSTSVRVFQEKADVEVVVTPSEIQPGESAQVEIFELQDGVRIPLLDPRTVSIAEGSMFGKLRSLATGQEAQEFVATTDELEFVANDVLDVESARIVIGVETPLGGGVIVTSVANEEDMQKNDRQPRPLKLDSKGVSFRAGVSLAMLGAQEFCLRKFKAEGVVVVMRQELDHFVVTVDPPTIAFTETARIFVQAKDAENKDVDLSPDALLTFSLEGESAFGTFVDAHGETLKTVPVELRDVRYADAHVGRILFAAVAANPELRANPIVRVFLQTNPTKTGALEIEVLEQTLRIVMVGVQEVRPLIPGEVRLVIPGEPTSSTEFRVQVTRGGAQVGGHLFELTTEYVDGSGGHDHRSPRRPREPEAVRFQNYGYFVSRQASPGSRINPLREATLADGQATYEYVASAFGDEIKIRAQSLQNPLLKDEMRIVERVRGLELLAVSGSYVKVGGTCNHHGPSDQLPIASPCQSPDNNHWGARDVVTSLTQIASVWLFGFPLEEPIHVNDISLPFGGLFDIDGDWRPRHRSHRSGMDVDVRTEIPGVREGIPVRNEEGRTIGNDDFVEISSAFGGAADIHEEGTDEEHYHIDF